MFSLQPFSSLRFSLKRHATMIYRLFSATPSALQLLHFEPLMAGF